MLQISVTSDFSVFFLSQVLHYSHSQLSAVSLFSLEVSVQSLNQSEVSAVKLLS